ncbi:hypothetical protein ColLi_06465 [Colletotrichum liriopes]|uniref:Uncharacterized protein n=1 Tax=Colletotrichum liriopes TaxID=708192 RepID=A0AA37GNE8_9PEZI|nr:hypothetical protein ColLi_06465 [Colletotrichum liriopes]
MPVNVANRTGRIRNGAARAKILIAPEYNAAPPTPATVRPAMSAPEVGASAQTIDPISKMISPVRYVHLTFNIV